MGVAGPKSTTEEGSAVPIWTLHADTGSFAGALLLRPPDAACLIDYPGVNVPFGEWLHKAVSSCRQCYYVPPNEWLLTDRRTPQIVRNTHKLLAVRLCHATGRRARVMYGRALALH